MIKVRIKTHDSIIKYRGLRVGDKIVYNKSFKIIETFFVYNKENVERVLGSTFSMNYNDRIGEICVAYENGGFDFIEDIISRRQV